MVSILWELRSQGLTNLQANEYESVILFLDVLKTNGCKKKQHSSSHYVIFFS